MGSACNLHSGIYGEIISSSWKQESSWLLAPNFCIQAKLAASSKFLDLVQWRLGEFPFKVQSSDAMHSLGSVPFRASDVMIACLDLVYTLLVVTKQMLKESK